MNSSNSSACRAVNSSAVTIGLLYGVFVLASVRMGGDGEVCVCGWGGGQGPVLLGTSSFSLALCNEHHTYLPLD